MSVKQVDFPFFPSKRVIREEEERAAEQRALEAEAVKLWGSGSPCERPWRPDTGPLTGPDARRSRSGNGGNSFPDFPPEDFEPDPPQTPWRNPNWCDRTQFAEGTAQVGYNSNVFPATGRGSGAAPPDVRRIMLAVSDDSLNWRRTNVIVADRADIPTMIWDPDTERFWMFFQIFDAHDKSGATVTDKIVTAFSARNSIDHWTFRTLGFSGGPERKIDPAVIYDAAKGRYVMYFTTPFGDKVFVATTSRLRDFYWEVHARPAYEVTGAVVQDPVVVQLDSNYFEMFAWGPGRKESYFAESTDGSTFTMKDSGEFEREWTRSTGAGPYPVMMSNAVAISESPWFRLYAFTQNEPSNQHRILSLRRMALVSLDGSTVFGETWTLDKGERLEVDLSTGYESVFVREAAVARSGDNGCFLMAYSTEIP